MSLLLLRKKAKICALQCLKRSCSPVWFDACLDWWLVWTFSCSLFGLFTSKGLSFFTKLVAFLYSLYHSFCSLCVFYVTSILTHIANTALVHPLFLIACDPAKWPFRPQPKEPFFSIIKSICSLYFAICIECQFIYKAYIQSRFCVWTSFKFVSYIIIYLLCLKKFWRLSCMYVHFH